VLGKDGLEVACEKGAGVLEVFLGIGFGGGDAVKGFVEDADDPLLFGKGWQRNLQRHNKREFYAFDCRTGTLFLDQVGDALQPPKQETDIQDVGITGNKASQILIDGCILAK